MFDERYFHHPDDWRSSPVPAKKPINTPTKFWIVCRDPRTVGHHEPANALTSEDAARRKAMALSRETGHRFYVLESVAACEPVTPPISWTSL